MFETVAVLAVIGVGMAIATPNLTRAVRTYRLNSGAQQVSNALQAAKFNAVRGNTTQSVFFNTSTNTISIGATTAAAIPLPSGVQFTSPTVGAPPVAATAVANAGTITGQESNPNTAVSFPAVTGNTNFRQASFNSRGLPVMTPGQVNWLYLTNTQGELMAITATSAGSIQTWRWDATASQWR